MKINRFIRLYRLKVQKHSRVIFLNVSRMNNVQRYCYLKYLIRMDENNGDVLIRKFFGDEDKTKSLAIQKVLNKIKSKCNKSNILSQA